MDEARCDLGVLAPVELEPARGVAHGLRDLLDGARRHGAEDKRNADRRRRAGRDDVALRVVKLLHADGRDEHGRAEFLPEHLDAQVARRDIAKHPRQDAPAVEGVEVRAHRPPEARAPGGEVEGGGVHLSERLLLEGDGVEREQRGAPLEPGAVDLELAAGVEGLGGIGGHGAEIRRGFAGVRVD